MQFNVTGEHTLHSTLPEGPQDLANITMGSLTLPSFVSGSTSKGKALISVSDKSALAKVAQVNARTVKLTYNHSTTAGTPDRHQGGHSYLIAIASGSL